MTNNPESGSFDPLADLLGENGEESEQSQGQPMTRRQLREQSAPPQGIPQQPQARPAPVQGQTGRPQVSQQSSQQVPPQMPQPQGDPRNAQFNRPTAAPQQQGYPANGNQQGDAPQQFQQYPAQSPPVQEQAPQQLQPAPPPEQPHGRPPGREDEILDLVHPDKGQESITRPELMDGHPPQQGFRGFMYKAFRWNLGPSPRELQLRREQRERLEMDHIKRQVDAENFRLINRSKDRTHGYCGFFSVSSEKGGVGKTTLSILLAYVLGEVRQDPVALANLNPDKGNASKRMGVSHLYSIRDLVHNAKDIPFKRHVHEFMEKVPGANVSVLGGDENPNRRESTSANDVKTVFQVLGPFFSIAVLDNGTGITHSAMEGSLQVSHGMTLVIENTDDAEDYVKSTLRYLEENGYAELRNRVILTVMSRIPDDPDSENPRASQERSEEIRDKFRNKVRDIVIVPYDSTLSRGGVIPFGNLSDDILRPIRQLAALLMDDLVQ